MCARPTHNPWNCLSVAKTDSCARQCAYYQITYPKAMLLKLTLSTVSRFSNMKGQSIAQYSSTCWMFHCTNIMGSMCCFHCRYENIDFSSWANTAGILLCVFLSDPRHSVTFIFIDAVAKRCHAWNSHGKSLQWSFALLARCLFNQTTCLIAISVSVNANTLGVNCFKNQRFIIALSKWQRLGMPQASFDIQRWRTFLDRSATSNELKPMQTART